MCGRKVEILVLDLHHNLLNTFRTLLKTEIQKIRCWLTTNVTTTFSPRVNLTIASPWKSSPGFRHGWDTLQYINQVKDFDNADLIWVSGRENKDTTFQHGRREKKTFQKERNKQVEQRKKRNRVRVGIQVITVIGCRQKKKS